MATRITTNNVPRDVIDASELSLSERAEFDYLDWEAIEDGRDSASFFRYRGQLYDLGEFSAAWGLSNGGLPDWAAGWHGYLSDSFFSGLLVRYSHYHDQVVVGRYMT